jgi:quinol monooxygenase YgiN
MISRIVDCQVKPEKLSEFKTTLNDQFIPQIRRQPGFVDILESVDPATGHFVCNTLWKTPEDVERYDKGLFQEMAGKLVPLLEHEPAVHTLEVETSSAHGIAAGKKAAAA